MVAPDVAVVNDSRPVIRWAPVAEAGHYRIQLRSRVPEGKTLVTLDTVVQDAEFHPPQPLADYHAQVQVTVSAYCRDGYGPASDPAAGGRFYIDTSSSCTLTLPLELRREGTQWRMTWPAVHLPDFDLYLDSTSDSTPYGMLPFQCQDKPVLLVEGFKEGAKTPASPVAANRQATKTV